MSLGVDEGTSLLELERLLARHVNPQVDKATICERDRGASQALRTDANASPIKEVAPSKRQRPVALLEVVPERVDIGELGGCSEPAIGEHALVHLGHVLLREVEIGREVDGDLGDFHLCRLAARLGHCLAQHLGEEIEAHAREVAVLLGAHERAGATNLEVAHGNAHAAAQVLVLVDGRKAISCLGRERGRGGEHEVRIRLRSATPNAALELVELGQAKALGVLDDQRVGARVVDAALDDGSGYQDVYLVLLEAQHHVLDLAGAHLAVRHANAGLWCGLHHAGNGVVDGRHTVAHVVDLPLALQLVANSGRDQIGVPLPHVHLDGQAPWRRGHDEAHVAHATHGHLHGARDGRCRERKDVHLLAHVLELLLVLHAKALLLVDDNEPEVMGVNVSREEPVRTDKHVYRACGKALESLPLLGGRHKAREHAHVEVKGREAGKERLEVLLGKNRRGAQHHDLLVVLAALERRAKSNLGLAKAHVAAKQPVHGLPRLYVGLDIGNGRSLVGSELVGEARLHVQLGGGVGRERVARHRGAAGVEVDKVKRELLCRAPGLARGTRPVGRVEPREARRRAIWPHVASDAVDLLKRHVELVAAGVFQEEVVAHPSGDLLAHDLREERDAMRGVDNVVTGLEREGHARGVHALGATPVTCRARGKVRNREHSKVRRRHHDAGGYRRIGKGNRPAA